MLPGVKIVDFGSTTTRRSGSATAAPLEAEEIKFTIKIGDTNKPTQLRIPETELVHQHLLPGREIAMSKGHGSCVAWRGVRTCPRRRPMAKGKILQMMVVPSQQS
jgi:hypothetical protein